MAYQPQVIVNSGEYISTVETEPRPIKHVDFFDSPDSFREKKKQIITSLNEISSIQESHNNQTVFAKVRLIKKAWAKSHRPVVNLFNEKNLCEVVGGEHYGEMIVKMLPGAATTIANKIEEKVEVEVRQKQIDGKLQPVPSLWRCELSTLDSISPYSSNDKLDSVDSLSNLAAWLIDNNKGFYVELFKTSKRSTLELSAIEDSRMYISLINSLRSISGIRVHRSMLPGHENFLLVFVTDGNETEIDMNVPYASQDIIQITSNKEKLSYVLNLITSQEIVRKVTPMLSIQRVISPSFKIDGTEEVAIPVPVADHYPVIGVVDTGISNIFSNWIVERDHNMPDSMQEKNHGSFISGLLVIGQQMNNPSICPEPDGCKLYDIPMIADEAAMLKLYPKADEDFYDVLKNAVQNAVENYNIRVFNLSFNYTSFRHSSDYSKLAKSLDYLAYEFDVIFIISAGNLIHPRPEWHKNWRVNKQNLLPNATRIIHAPGESILNLCVGALNATDLGLASYSRVGKGSTIGVKPDIVHVGGDGVLIPNIGYGLYSVSKEGKAISESGTSYAAPLVAKTIASLADGIEGFVPRETLIALTIHSCKIPVSMKDKNYKDILKDCIGFGMPSSASEILSHDNHSITMIFSNRIFPKKRLSFPLVWPRSLVKNGKLYGTVKLTLVYKPQIMYEFGDEMVRERLEASLRSRGDDGKGRGILQPIFKAENSGEEHLFEWQLIDEDLKWSPVKVWTKEISRGIKRPTAFTLDIEYQSRDSNPSQDGVPFTAILTISDPKKEAPVYEQMTSSLIDTGVQLSDIQTAARHIINI